MVLGSKAEDAITVIPIKDRKTVTSIKEIARNHSDLEIYAVLKESNMDPDETAQKLLNQDPFHEVRKRRDKKKENTGHKVSNEPRQISSEPRNISNEPRKMMSVVPRVNHQPSTDRNVRRGHYTRNTPGISHEFRIVRDNRINQNSNGVAKKDALHAVNSPSEQPLAKSTEKSHPEVKLQTSGLDKLTISDVSHAKGSHSSDNSKQWLEVRHATVSKPSLESQKEVEHIPSTPTSSRSAFGVYSSLSDPVHVPSGSRSAGTVGAIRREVGVVGKRPNPQPSVSSNSFPSSSVRRDASCPTTPSGQSSMIPKTTQLSQNSTAERPASGNSVLRNFPSNLHNNKQHTLSAPHQKASLSTMEWKPKSVKKPSSTGPETNNQISAPTLMHTDTSSSTNVDAAFPDKLQEANIHESEHVIIPKHLRVPESERVHVTFGSFGAALESSMDSSAALSNSKNIEESINGIISMGASAPEESSEDASLGERPDFEDGETRNFRSESLGSPAHSAQPALENADSRSMSSYADIGLVQGHGLSQSSPEPHDTQTSASLPTFPEAYDIQQNYEVPFLRETIEDNIQAQGLGSLPEVSSNVAVSGTAASVAMLAHHQPASQHQPVTQLYPQLQFSHFPNYFPYRQFLSPVYVPPMAMPTNYTTNPAYPHPSNGSNYLLMPGGSSHLAGSGMKFAASQFKPAAGGSPAGYGNYSSPAGYAISSPGPVGNAAGIEDIARIKYKDSNLYVPNPQAETSEMWVQNPRDISAMQSPHYYNVPGQAPHAAYLPTHAGHAASFNPSVQPSHIQFPGLYHPPQPANIANPHHLVHQQVPPSIGGNAGVGMAVPGQQVGSYQQQQLSHLNWSSSF